MKLGLILIIGLPILFGAGIIATISEVFGDKIGLISLILTSALLIVKCT